MPIQYVNESENDDIRVGPFRFSLTVNATSAKISTFNFPYDSACKLDLQSILYDQAACLHIKLPLALFQAPRGHGNELFSSCRVNSNATVKVGLGGLHLDGHSESLQHLVSSISNNMETNDSLLIPGAD